ncbi:MAG: rhodanese-related sulfurtransferase [Candidatus Promineifilaceae bacterium]|jgi:rhodanese-related sulfurtransferase
MRYFRTFFIVGFFSLALFGCQSKVAPNATEPVEVEPSTKNSDGYIDIDVEQLADQLQTKDFTLINVHIPFAGDIPDTDLTIPFDQIPAFVDQLPQDKDAPIVIYCRSGSMSTQAAKTLVALGYSNIQEVDGGMNAWVAFGQELITD